jgi:hypothetical protein
LFLLLITDQVVVASSGLHKRAATFYEDCGFRRQPGTIRLVHSVSDLATAHALRGAG